MDWFESILRDSYWQKAIGAGVAFLIVFGLLHSLVRKLQKSERYRSVGDKLEQGMGIGCLVVLFLGIDFVCKTTEPVDLVPDWVEWIMVGVLSAFLLYVLVPSLWRSSKKEKELVIMGILCVTCVIVAFSSVDRIGWPLALVLVFLIYMVSRCLVRERKTNNEALSYRLELVIEPHWYDILEKVLPGLEKHEELLIFRFLEHMDSKRSVGAWYTWHRFVIFEYADAPQQVWYDVDKTFVDSPEIRIRLFPMKRKEEAVDALASFSVEDKAFHKLISREGMREKLVTLMADRGQFDAEGHHIRFYPWIDSIRANFSTIGPIRDTVDGKELSSVPLYVIIPFLYDVSKHGSAMKAVRTFPEDVKQNLDERGVTYFDESRNHNIEYWTKTEFIGSIDDFTDKEYKSKTGIELYSNRVDYHWFSTKYFSLGVKVKFAEQEV